MVWKVLNTKSETKVRREIAVLEAMGYTVFKGNWSSYNYFEIFNPNNNVSLNVSKGYDNKRRLYNKAFPIKGIAEKVDYIALLNRERTPYKAVETTSENAKMRETLRFNKWLAGWKLEDIEKAKKEIEKKQKELERIEAGYREAIDNIESVREWRRKR